MAVLGSVLPLIQLVALFYLGLKFITFTVNLSYVINSTEWYQYAQSVCRCLLINYYYDNANAIAAAILPQFLQHFAIEFREFPWCK